MDSDVLHNKIWLHHKWIRRHVAYKTEHATYQIPHVTCKFAHFINEIKHMTCKFAHIVDGFGHGANTFGCNMNEYRHMT